MNVRSFVFILVLIAIPANICSAAEIDARRASVAGHLAKEFAGLGIHKVYIPDFCDSTSGPSDLGAFFAATFSELIAKKAKGFVVESRIDGHHFLQQNNFTDCNLIRPEVLSKFSSALSVDSVLSASLSGDKDSYSMDFILRDLSGRELSHSHYSERRYAQTEALFPASSSPPGWPFCFAALDGVSTPKGVHVPNPDPGIAHGTHGTIVISSLITATGKIDQIRVVHGLTPEIDSAVIEVLKSWRFEPARDADGNAVSVRAPLLFSFYRM